MNILLVKVSKVRVMCVNMLPVFGK